MEKLVLIRKGSEVFDATGKKCTIVKQETKGPGNEVVKVEGLPNSNGKKWVSLRLLAEGRNELEAKAKETTYRSVASTTSAPKEYELTNDEVITIKMLQGQIDEIIEAAKARFVPQPRMDKNPMDMTPEERTAWKEAHDRWLKYMGF